MDVNSFTNLEEAPAAGRARPQAATQESGDPEAAQAFSETVEAEEPRDGTGEAEVAAGTGQPDPLLALMERWSGITSAIAADDAEGGPAVDDSPLPVIGRAVALAGDGDAAAPAEEAQEALPEAEVAGSRGAARIADAAEDPAGAPAARSEAPAAIPKAANEPGAVIAQLPEGLLIQREGGVEFVASARPAARVVLHDPGAVIRQVSDAMVIQRDGQVEVALSPEELGRVRLVMSGREHGLHVVVMAERPEVLDMLRRNAPALLEQFADVGVGDAALEFRQQDSGAEKGEDGGGAEDRARPEPAMIATLPGGAAPESWTAAPGRLDIRL